VIFTSQRDLNHALSVFSFFHPGRKHGAARASRSNLLNSVLFMLVIGFTLWVWTIPSAGQLADSDAALAPDLAAAKQGDLGAQLKVAKAFNETRHNYSEALKWFEAASKQNSLEATAWLGSLYLYGHGVAQDLPRALSLIQSAVDSENPVGLRFMGAAYEEGLGVTRDYAKALSFYSKAAAQQDAGSFDRIGNLYLRGLGVSKSRPQALEAFLKGAKLGDSWAQLHAGQMEEGNRSGTGLSETGRSDATSLVNQGSPRAIGKTSSTTPPDYAAALQWYTASAAQGNRVAAFKAGKMFEEGRGTTQNLEKAVEYYRQSAKRQYAAAQVALGRAYEFGAGAPENLVYAYVLYSLASNQNDAGAIESLRSLRAKLTPSQSSEAGALLTKIEERKNLQ
jgi:uncharacterized protein